MHHVIPILGRLALLIPLFLATALSGRALAAGMPDTDLKGGDYRSFELISPVPSFCENVCKKDSRCRAWTFSWPGKRAKRAKCFLKESVGEKRKDTCCVSGVKERTLWPGGNREPENAGGATTTPPVRTDDGGIRRTPPASQPPADTPSSADAPVRQVEDMPSERPDATVDMPTDEEMRRRERMQAEKVAFCNKYADRAVAASRQNQLLRCGYAGGRWGHSRTVYFNWCMKNPPEKARANTAARERLIRQCRNTPPEDRLPARADLESCREYASISVQQARRAREAGCGYRGPRWTLNYDRHFRWCRTATITERRGELAVRRAALKRCERTALPDRWPNDAVLGERFRRPQSGGFIYRWKKVRGPGRNWRTPWQPSRSGKCPMVSNCDCGGENTCGMYRPGEAVLYWPEGCGGPAWVVLCQVRRR